MKCFASLFFFLIAGVVNAEVLETPNFSIHHDDPALARRIGDAAERTRKETHMLWFDEDAVWAIKCELHLHADGPAGYTTVLKDGGRVLSLRIDIRATPGWEDVVSHEVTHAVIAMGLPDQAVPRWADEGAAVRSESPAAIERRVGFFFHDFRGNSFTAKQLMLMEQYPEDTAVFYAESLLLVRFLAAEKGHRVFMKFLREAHRRGYEHALRVHYGFESFDELEKKWRLRVWPTPGQME